MPKDVKEYVAACPECAQAETPRHSTRVLLRLFWAKFCRLLGISVSLSSGFHTVKRSIRETQPGTVDWPALSVHTGYLHVVKKCGLGGVCSQLPSIYSHVVYGYQQPLFSTQDCDVMVLLPAAVVRLCHLAWRGACQTFLKSVSSYKKWANKRHSPAQQYAPGQKIWLSTADLPLGVENKKFAPRFAAPTHCALRRDTRQNDVNNSVLFVCNFAEKNYHLHSGKLEFLALKWAICERFRDYLYYAPAFTVYTDNNPLTYVLTTAKLNATTYRWVAELADFQFSIKYRPGRANNDADGLSRMPFDMEQYMETCTQVIMPEVMNSVINPTAVKLRVRAVNSNRQRRHTVR
ncbi:hypothetical protein Q8A73_001008 [Channa argus]|nr:hypothetical protein Q8A73_001008 [Channa argus]